MEKEYYDLESSILSCLLQKPELMEKVILEDKYFINYNKLWKFMKSFYNNFYTFDIVLMNSMCRPKYKFMIYIKELIMLEPIPDHLEMYQEMLIKLFEECKKDKWIINKVYDLANDLVMRKIEVDDFKNKIDNIYNNAEKIFKNN